uniref:Uncharacterized protein n=1 Tax=Romanomermis culicivorax TaxID=13658 RepID=A0A915LB08_ROMCU
MIVKEKLQSLGKNFIKVNQASYYFESLRGHSQVGNFTGRQFKAYSITNGNKAREEGAKVSGSCKKNGIYEISSILFMIGYRS